MVINEEERARMRAKAKESQERFLDAAGDEEALARKYLRNEIRILITKHNWDKFEFVAEIESRYNTRDLMDLTKEQLSETLERLRARAKREEKEVEEVDREAHEVLKGRDPGKVVLEGSKPLKGSGAELVPVVTGAVVPVLSEEQVIEHFQRFQHLKRSVLTDADYMFIGENGKPCEKGKHVSEYIKKSGWRKIALMFNISISVENEWEIEGEDKNGRWTGWAYQVKAIAPNGRFAEAVGVCTTRNSFFCKRVDKQTGAVTWIDTDEKNLIETAQTVAINRAISDLVGSGELSAEEVE